MEENFLLDLVSALDQSKSKEQINSDIKQLEKVINMLQLTGTFAKGSTKKELNAYIKSLQSQLNHVKLTAKIDSKNLKSEVNSALNKVSYKDLDLLNIDENKTKLKIQKVIADAKAYAEKNPVSVGVNIESKKSKLGNDLTSYLNRNTKISESSVLLQKADKVRNLINAINDKKSLREATDAFQLYKSEVSATGFATKSTTDKIKNMVGHITKLGSVFSVASMAFSSFTKSLGTLKDIDDILTEISKTSNMTAQELEKLGNISFKSASKYGKTATDYLTGIQEMSRSGFYGEKGTAMAEQSLLAQTAGNMTADVANKYILATNAAYKFNGEAEKLNAVLDGQNSITNQNSVALSDMAIAMSEAGTVASSYRVSIEDLSAMIGTMESVTKLGGSEVGNGIKAILINLQNINSSKIVNTLDTANASMTEFVNGTEKLRDPISILRDLAKTFNQLDEDDALRAEILTNIGGKHQASKLAALLQNMELFDKMLVDYSEGAGSAMEEAMKSANNWSGKLNQIQNSWDSLVNSLTSKKAVLGGLTFFDKLIQGTESAVDTLGEIPVVLTTINTAMTAMKKDYGITQLVNPETKKLDVQGNIFGIDITAIKNQKRHFEEAKDAIAIWNTKLKSGKANLDSFNNKVIQNNAQLKEYLSTCSKDAPASLKGYRQYLESTGQATEGLRTKTILLNAALTMFGSIAIQAVITGITEAFDKFNETVEESQEKIDDINSKISDLKSQIEELNNLEYKSDFDNQKISQLERELELQEKILEIEQKRMYQNQIGTSYSDYFDADSLITKQQAEYDHNNKKNYANLSRAYSTYKSSLEEIDSQLASLQEKLNNEDLIGHDRFITEEKIAKLTEKRNALLEKQQAIEDQLTLNMGEYLQNYQTAQEAVDSGLLTGSDLEKAESMAEYWNQMYQDSSEIVTNIQKMNGTYDNTNDLLEGMFGGISRDDLASLSDDDKRIALSFDPDNIIGFEELQQKIAETKGDIEGLNGTDVSIDTTVLSGQLTSSEDALDQFQASVKSATDAYSTLLSGNYTSAELLDCIQEINKAMSDMGGSLNWEYINSQTDSLELLGDTIQHISQKYAESILSDAGIDIDSEFGQMLANMIQQIYDAEAAFEGMNSQLDNLQSSYQTLTGILESYNETGYINLDNLQSLLTADENLIQMLEVENGQLVLNQAAYENLVAVQLMEFKAKLNDAAAAEIETLAKQKAEQATNLNADASQNAVEKLDAETNAFNRNTSAAIANAVAKAEESGVSEEDIQGIFDKYNEVWNATVNNFSGDFDGFMGGGTSAAGKAGKEAGDAYLDAFKEEYDHLKDQLDRGEISEAQYLNALRRLYTRYFKDRKEYLNEYKKYENEYLTGMLDLHNKALSGISTLLSRKISAAEDVKDASISALQEEKEKAEEAYQAKIDAIEKEKDAIDDLIKEKNKKIESYQAEIDAIEREAESRKKNIQLEKDQFVLEKMLNQRSSMVYKDGQFIYEADTSGVRDAREKVREDQEALQIDNLKNEISLIQKEIDLLEEKKDSLSEEQDHIQKLMDESNRYYDNLIKEQEKMWDSMIKGMEQQKSRWEELAEVKETAEAFSYIQQVFGDLGYTVEDVLNGSDAAFEDFKAQYISLISDVNNNSDFTEGLAYATGIAKENLGSFLDKTKETADGLDKLGEKSSEMDKLSDSATTASTSAGEIATSMGELSTSTEGVSDNLTGINDALTAIPQSEKLDNLADAFSNLGEAIKGVADALGIGEDEAVGGLVSALQEISTLSLDEAGGGEEGSDSSGGGIISQFQMLKTAVEDVTSAISGGSSSGSSDGNASGSSSASMSAGAGGEGAGGLVGAIEKFKSTADEALGGGGEEGEGSEGGGTGAIPQFKELETAVNDVTAAIGIEDLGGGEGDENTLIGALRTQYETVSEVLPEEKALFEELLESITACVTELNNMVSTLGSIPEIGGSGSISVTPHAKGTVGSAFAKGTGGLPKAEKNALVSEYGQTEMTVLPNGNTIITDEPTMMDLPKDTVIYNEAQTKKIMDNKINAQVVESYADGTVQYSDGTIVRPDGVTLRPLQPGDRAYELQKAFEPLLKKIQEGGEAISNAYFEHQKQMEKWTKEITNNTAINNITNNRNVQQPITIQIGDINLTGVQDVNGLAQAIKTRLPNAMLQEIHRR